jgi:hypothetical protein
MRNQYYDEHDEYEVTTSRYKYNCGGWASYSGPCGASDCGSCRNGSPDEEEEEGGSTVSRLLHIAAKDYEYAGIRRGDLYTRTTGFSYITGGKRTGYMGAERRLAERGPTQPGHDAGEWAVLMVRRAAQLKRRRRIRKKN